MVRRPPPRPAPCLRRAQGAPTGRAGTSSFVLVLAALLRELCVYVHATPHAAQQHRRLLSVRRALTLFKAECLEEVLLGTLPRHSRATPLAPAAGLRGLVEATIHGLVATCVPAEAAAMLSRLGADIVFAAWRKPGTPTLRTHLALLCAMPLPVALAPGATLASSCLMRGVLLEGALLSRARAPEHLRGIGFFVACCALDQVGASAPTTLQPAPQARAQERSREALAVARRCPPPSSEFSWFPVLARKCVCVPRAL